MNLVALFFAMPLVAMTLLGLLVYGIVVVAREARERYRAGRTDRRVATQWAEAAAAKRLGQWEARAVGSRLGHKRARG